MDTLPVQGLEAQKASRTLVRDVSPSFFCFSYLFLRSRVR